MEDQGINRQVLHQQAWDIGFRIFIYFKPQADTEHPLCCNFFEVQLCTAKTCFNVGFEGVVVPVLRNVFTLFVAMIGHQLYLLAGVHKSQGDPGDNFVWLCLMFSGHQYETCFMSLLGCQVLRWLLYVWTVYGHLHVTDSSKWDESSLSK
jgi:hypothetical protein